MKEHRTVIMVLQFHSGSSGHQRVMGSTQAVLVLCHEAEAIDQVRMRMRSKKREMGGVGCSFKIFFS